MKDLIEKLKNPEQHYSGNFDTPARANAVLLSLCQEAAQALEDYFRDATKMIEQSAPVQQEPVAIAKLEGQWPGTLFIHPLTDIAPNTKLYTSPQPAQRKPLTDDEIWDAYVRSPVCVNDSALVHLYAFARAIEAKLKEKNT